MELSYISPYGSPYRDNFRFRQRRAGRSFICRRAGYNYCRCRKGIVEYKYKMFTMICSCYNFDQTSLEKIHIFGMDKIPTQDSWVGSANTTSLQCHPPKGFWNFIFMCKKNLRLFWFFYVLTFPVEITSFVRMQPTMKRHFLKRLSFRREVLWNFLTVSYDYKSWNGESWYICAFDSSCD